jgi:hypothetical protein
MITNFGATVLMLVNHVKLPARRLAVLDSQLERPSTIFLLFIDVISGMRLIPRANR